MIEFDQPGYLNTPVGDLAINQLIPGVGYFMAAPAKCTVRRPLRVTSDERPQGDGKLLHRRFSSGTELTIALELWSTLGEDGDPACGQDLRVMLETLGLYLQSILNGRGRWFWTPSGYGDDRLLDECRWLVDVSRELDGKRTTVTFGIDSPFPYFIDATQGSSSGSAVDGAIPVPEGVPTTIVNDGNHAFQPVIQALGSFTAFEIENGSVLDDDGEPLRIVYDSTRPGAAVVAAPDYAEIDTFRETVYLNGNEANLKAGIDPLLTDYFYLRPGDNEIVVTGCDLEFLVNNAWVPA